jgi:hypothetical protein
MLGCAHLGFLAEGVMFIVGFALTPVFLEEVGNAKADG